MTNCSLFTLSSSIYLFFILLFLCYLPNGGTWSWRCKRNSLCLYWQNDVGFWFRLCKCILTRNDEHDGSQTIARSFSSFLFSYRNYCGWFVYWLRKGYHYPQTHIIPIWYEYLVMTKNEFRYRNHQHTHKFQNAITAYFIELLAMVNSIIIRICSYALCNHTDPGPRRPNIKIT